MEYEVLNNRTYRIATDGERELLANFAAEIVQETRFVDGRVEKNNIKIRGTKEKNGEEIILPEVIVNTNNFPAMAWVLQGWGVQAVIASGGSIKDDLRTAIQLRSKPIKKTVYRHVGWTDDLPEPCYLHASGGIGPKGNDPTIEVRLPSELQHYNFSEPLKNIPNAIRATLSLTQLGKREVTWPLLAATFAPLFAPVDFAIHLTGRTGTYKSELMSLFQCHYGCKMDARNLPGSWSSTPNAIEAQTFITKNAAYVLDDYVPAGTSWQVRAYQTTADKIVRSQGNQSGRARLTDTSNLQTTMYPRGIILSTGEDTPEGHSIRARMLILELAPGDIQLPKLTTAQNNRKLYEVTTQAYIQNLAKNPVPTYATEVAALRDKMTGIGHTRTPSMAATLITAISHFLQWAKTAGALKNTSALLTEATKAITDAANEQRHYLENADPVDIFTATIRQIFAAGLGHVRTVNGGIPRGAAALGWTQENFDDQIAHLKS